MIRHRIFIAHSNEKLLALYKSNFKPHFGVDSASDGLSALRRIKLQRPHLILSAIDLPILSGIGLLKSIRSHPQLYTCPFIVLGKTSELAEALSFGANDFFDHSQSFDQMLPKIHYHIRVNQHVQIN